MDLSLGSQMTDSVGEWQKWWVGIWANKSGRVGMSALVYNSRATAGVTSRKDSEIGRKIRVTNCPSFKTEVAAAADVVVSDSV